MARRRLDVILSAQGVGSFRREFGVASQAVRGLESRTDRLRRSLGGATRVLRGVSTAAVGLGAAAAVGITKFVNAADQIDKGSRRASLATDAFQELRFGADLAGVSGERFGKAMEGLSKRLGEARAGTGTLITILRKTSPELLKVLQSTTSTEEGFNVLAEAISQMENASDQAALANAAFGRSGIELLPFLRQGRSEIERFRQEARDLGIVLDQDAVDAAVAAKDNFTRLTASIRGLGLAVGGELAPELKDLSQALVDGIPVVKGFLDSIGGGRTILIGVAALLAGGVVAGIAAVVLAIGGIPLAIGGAVAAIIAGASLVLKYWEPIRDFFVGLGHALVEGIRPLIEFGKSTASALGFGGAELSDAVGNVLPGRGGLLGEAGARLATPAAGAVAAAPVSRASAAEISGRLDVDVRVSDDRVRASVTRGEASGGIEIDAAAGPALAGAW